MMATTMVTVAECTDVFVTDAGAIVMTQITQHLETMGMTTTVVTKA